MNRKNIMGLFLIGVCVLGLAWPGFSMFHLNLTEKSFTDPEGITGPSNPSETINALIIKGAVSFLKGNACINLLVSKLEAAELEGFSFPELQILVSDALSHIMAARNSYLTLNSMVATLSYNPVVIDQLKALDYSALARDYGMNMDIFERVRLYLQTGDIRGVYTRVYTYTDTIITMLGVVQKEIETNTLPNTNTIFRLNQETIHMALFGQYIAQMFRHIK